MGNNKSIVLGGIGLVLMYVFSQMLVIKPESIGFVEGVMFSWVVKNSIGAAYTQFTQGLSLFFVAFVASFWIFQKNRNKIFYCIILLTIIKWAIDVFYVSGILNGRSDIKIWAIVLFFIGTFIAHRNFIAAANPVAEMQEVSELSSD